MTQNETKPWERPWTTKEMIDNASDWNLAGDAGLLKYLEEFSEKMLAKAKDTNDKLNDLVSSADETSLALQNATNELMGLRNTQFIESRVYEDDETMPIKTEPEKEEPPKQTEADRLEEMKKAIFNGLEIIDKYYEKVEIPESDSEEDTDEPNIVYRRIDPYIDRPLPYVIGTSEWHKYWHVGLAHSSSDSEVENEQEQFSETESEQEIQNLPSRDRSQIPGISDSETEDLPKTKMAKPVANSTFNDNTGTKNMFDSSSESETGSLPPQMNAVNNNFAEELAAKLGKVESSAGDGEVNTKPIRKQPTNISTGMFSDEPPPLDDDDIFTSKNMKSGLFSGGDGLFDDIDNDNDFWNTKSSTASKPTVSGRSKSRDELFQNEDENENDIFAKKVEEKLSNTSVEQPKISGGLFDDDDDDELFGTASLTQSKKTILAPFKTAAPLVSDEPPELEPSVAKTSAVEETKRKKPVGGVSVLGPSDSLNQQIGKMLKNRAPSSSESETEPDLPVPPKPTSGKSTSIFEPPKQTKPGETKKIDSIFDDTSPLFNDDIFNSDSVKKFTSNLFDAEPAALEDELFKTNNEKVEKPEPDLFSAEPPPVTPTPKARTLFSDTVKDDDDLFSTKPLPTVEENIPPKMTAKKVKTHSGIFSDDEDNDLFASVSKPKTHDLFDPNPPALNDRTPKPRTSVDLFDPTPPELDESDTKSESHSQFSLDNEPVSFGSMNVARVSLFDNEPPLLSNESSGIVKDQSTRLDSEDSSFLPCMTSSRRQSDLFQDHHQISDSLFTSKLKQSIVTESSKSDLSKIPEHETLTKIEITPSGNESSLLDNSSANNSVFSTTETVAKPHEKTTDATPKLVEKTSEPVKKQISLFDDEDDLFQPPKIAEKPKSKTVSLFHESDSDDDLFSNKSFGSKNSSSSEILNNTSSSAAAKKPVKPLKNKNIFDDDLFSAPNVAGVPDVDLFKKSEESVEKRSSNAENKMEKRDDQTDETTNTEKAKNIANRENDEKKFQYEENLKKDEVKSVPKKSLSFEKNNETEKDKEEMEKEKEETETNKEETDGQIMSSGQSPGKLKTNLQINVAALLPGAAPPRRHNLEKSVSLDSSSENNQNSPEKYSKTQEKSPEFRHVLEKSISFDCPVESNEILPSAAKERVKIPIKRRPSSRRARQEAIRKSAIDFDEFIAETESVTPNNINTMPDTVSDKTDTENLLNITNNNVADNTSDKTMNVNMENKSRHVSNPLSPSTDEEDFFSIPRTQQVADNFAENSLFGKAPVISPTETLAEPREQRIEPEVAKIENPLEITKVPDVQKSDLFATATKSVFNSNLEPKTKTKIADTSIFSSSDSENDLFGSSKKDTKKAVSKAVVDNNNAVLSSDEDLFKPPVTATSSAVASKSTINILAHQDSLFEEEDIFSTKKAVSKAVVDNNNAVLSSDEDLFKPPVTATSSAVASKSTINILAHQDSLFEEEDIFSTKKMPPKSTLLKKSLFDDDDDDNDDDIFGASSNSGPKSSYSSITPHGQTIVKKAASSSRVKKLSTESAENILDPLDALKK